MPRFDYTTCRGCGRHAREVGPLSHTRLCGECGPVVQTEHNLEMHLHTGPYFERWRRRVAASVGAVIPDDLEGAA